MSGLGRTAKVVVIGDSGVGKTSLRGQVGSRDQSAPISILTRHL
jgi:GTPase SAR1 family protein